MWRTKQERGASARTRLERAKAWWGWQPHDAQQRLLCSAASVRVAACGRRWGKTESLSVDIASLALTEQGSRQIVVAPTEAQARILGDAVWERLEKALASGDPVLGDRTLHIRARPQSDFNADADCSRPGSIADFLPDGGAGRAQSARAVGAPDYCRRGRACPRPGAARSAAADAGGPGRRVSAGLVAEWPPVGVLHAVRTRHDRRQTVGGVSYQSFQCPTTDNRAHLDAAWLASQREDMGEALYAQEFSAQFLDDFGMVFREDDIAAATCDLPGVRLERSEIQSDPVPGHYYVVGIDWGRKWDYTVVTVLDAEASPAKVVHLSRWRGTSWEQQAADTAGIIACFLPRRVLADGNSIGDPIAEMLEAHLRKQMPRAAFRPSVERFTFSADSKQQLVDRLQVGLSARALQFPAHKALLNELRCFEYAPGGPGRLKMAASSGGHDDCVISLALAYYAAPNPSAAPRIGHGILLGSQGGVKPRE